MITSVLRPIAAGIAAALLPLAVAPGPFAQASEQSVATLRHVHGNVLVSGETGLASGDEAARVGKGSRIITTAKSDVTVVYDDGCEVTLKPNQRFEVKVDMVCGERMLLAESILDDTETALAAAAGGAAAAAAGGTTAAAVTASGLASLTTAAVAVPAVTAGLTGLAALTNVRETQNVSPS